MRLPNDLQGEGVRPVVRAPRMRLGVHQPYLFPYLPYYQLMFVVDRFVAYDDVAWIKNGWINRNRLRISGRLSYFTIPVRRATASVDLDTVEIAAGRWRRKIVRSLEQSYRAAPHRDEVVAMVERVVTSSSLVADVAVASLEAVRDYLGYSVPIVRARGRYDHQGRRGQERLIEVCRAEAATEYLSAPGGSALYDRHAFSTAGVTLRFLKPSFPPYRQGTEEFVPGLSIIDALMYNSVDEMRHMLTVFEVV